MHRQNGVQLAIMDYMQDTSRVSKRSPSKQQKSATEKQGLPRLRRLRLPPHKLIRFKRVVHPVKLPSAWQITKKTSQQLWRARRPLLGIFIVYAVLSILLVRGFGSTGDVNALKQQLSQGFGGNAGQLASGVTSLTNTLASSGTSATASAGVYQLLLGIIVSLATIWTLREMLAGNAVRVRDAFYKSMTPFITFFLVLLLIFLQALPFLIGGGLYTVAVSYGIAVTVVEKLLWVGLFLVLAAVSIYMLCSSVFGLYIVTLPEMTPRKALRSARHLVQYRRASVFRKVAFLLLGLALVSVVLMMPVVFLAPGAVSWIFFVVGLAYLIIANAYMYTLYRELLV